MSTSLDVHPRLAEFITELERIRQAFSGCLAARDYRSARETLASLARFEQKVNARLLNMGHEESRILVDTPSLRAESWRAYAATETLRAFLEGNTWLQLVATRLKRDISEDGSPLTLLEGTDALDRVADRMLAVYAPVIGAMHCPDWVATRMFTVGRCFAYRLYDAAWQTLFGVIETVTDSWIREHLEGPGVVIANVGGSVAERVEAIPWPPLPPAVRRRVASLLAEEQEFRLGRAQPNEDETLKAIVDAIAYFCHLHGAPGHDLSVPYRF